MAPPLSLCLLWLLDWRVPIVAIGLAAICTYCIRVGFGNVLAVLLVLVLFLLKPVLGYLPENGVGYVGFDSAVLPIGFSLLVFQAVAICLDSRNGAFSSVLKNINYFSFFAQVPAGPIERGKSFLSKLGRQSKRVSSRRQRLAVFYLVEGLVFKCWVAEPLFVALDTSEVGFLWGLLYFVALYADFFSYTQLARCGALFWGVTLHRNFRNPLAASGVVDFWGRWHISLLDWSRKYLLQLQPFSGIARYLGYSTGRVVVSVSALAFWHGMEVRFLSFACVTLGYLFVERFFNVSVWHGLAKKLLFFSYLGLLGVAFAGVGSFFSFEHGFLGGVIFSKASFFGLLFCLMHVFLYHWRSVVVRSLRAPVLLYGFCFLAGASYAFPLAPVGLHRYFVY